MPAPKTYKIRGSEQKGRALKASGDIEITSARRLVPGSSRDATQAEVEAAPDDVVRVELENGFVLWSRADDLLRERGKKTVARDGAEAWEIDTRPPTHGGERGWLGLGIKVLDFFGVDLKGKAAGALGAKLEVKSQQDKTPGFYRCSLEDAFALSPVPVAEQIPAGPGPLLVFIHGTGSSTSTGFGKLWDADNTAGKAARSTFKEVYGERVFAFEHRTLTQSPIANALELAAHLPDGAEVHVVTHSRGGLVGELLCLGERDRGADPLKPDLLKTLFAADRTVAEQVGLSPLDAKAAAERDAAYDADRQALIDLRDALDRKQLKVRRFVRVACPARGTTLASGRLDRWLSVLDFVSGDGLFGDGVDFLLAVVKERTDPRTLPGLEAMMPGSALTRLLQHPDLQVVSDLTVIAGDIEKGDSIWSQIKTYASDWFYGAEHDLVVNTGSMYGGIRRPDKGARFQRDQGSKVNHFNYFLNDKSVKWLVAGLTRAEGADAGFMPIGAAKQEAPKWREAVRRSRAGGSPQPLAVVLPGAMGSVLHATGEGVWVNYWRLLRGGLKRLRMGAADIEATDLLDDFYGPLLEFLARSHRVEIFPYDWRLSIRDAANRLAEKLEGWLPEAERTGQPVHLVAHSMGGLVTRAMIADGGRGTAVWRRIVALPNSRFLMLGTPNKGSHEAVRWLTGNNATQQKLSLLDITQSTDDIIDIVRNYPGLLELLPFGESGPDFSQPGLWKKLKEDLMARWTPADETMLRQTQATWAFLKQAAPDPQHMVYVAGCQPATVVDYRLADYDDPHLAGRKRLEFIGTREGDGTVTWQSGALPDVPTWYVEDTAHDGLCKQTRAFPGYLDLLTTGKTTRLPDTAPGKARAVAGEPERFPMPAIPFTDDIPDERSVRSLGFGPGQPVEDQAEPVAPVIQVSICHGDLAYAKHPVLVGHYMDDTIVSAEAALDERLDNALTRRLKLGLYPGKLGTHALFFNEKAQGKPAGAVVIGLGQVGELSPGLLESGVRAAMLDFALQIALWPDGRFGPADSPRSAALTCLLVGSGAGGMQLRDSMEAILRGAVAANAKLMEAELEGRVLIDRIEFLELFQDVAIVAAEALEKALTDGQLADTVAWKARVIDEGQGRRRRVRFEEAPDWWHRLEVIEEKNGNALRFIASTDRARAEETLATGQLQLADAFIRQASQSPSANAEVAKTLFEMLLPNRLKEMAPRQTSLVVLVDKVSARFPWELLEDRWNQTGRPPAVAAGLVRQLKTPEFRARPAQAFEAKALVVGNPDLAGWDQFADLPGARQEAEKVVGLLGTSGFRVVESIDEKADAILAGLHKDAWRILHLAGHGMHEFVIQPKEGDAAARPATPVSGMVIGKEVFLTPGDVEQMRWVPELVFINCCHLGKTLTRGPSEYSRLAANLALQFINMGVKAVVASGWAVDDSAAHAFAISFYTHMLDGDLFGEAVRAAREETWKRFPGVNTWGAYQCYGDPSYRLRGDGSAPLSRAARRYHAPAELIADLNNHAEMIHTQVREKGEDPEKLTGLREKIGNYFSGIPENQRDNWLKRADVAAAAGFAWGETAAYAEAIEWLEKALKAEQGECPIRAVEQCANFQVRRSGEKWQQLREAGEGDGMTRARQELIACIESAIADLDLLYQRAATTERLNLLGSACKRLAWLHVDEARRFEALVNMANYYWQAYERESEKDPYPFTNWAVAKVLAAQFHASQGGDWQKTLSDDIQGMVEAAQARNTEKPNFWDSVAAADCELARLLHEGKLKAKDGEATAERIVELYRAAARRGASPREFASVREHVDFVVALSGAVPKPASELLEALASIRASL